MMMILNCIIAHLWGPVLGNGCLTVLYCEVVIVFFLHVLCSWFRFITHTSCVCFMHYIHIGLAPKYLSDCLSTVSAASGRYRLRSTTGSAAYILPRTRTRFGERGFFYSGPATWNTLPSDLHDVTDMSTFRKRLQSVLFDRDHHFSIVGAPGCVI